MPAVFQRLRRARSVVAYWRDGQLVFENYLARVRIAASPLAAVVLDFFTDWRSPAEFARALPEYAPRDRRRALTELTSRKFLLWEGSSEARADEELERVWRPWLPAAGLLHFSAKDSPFTKNLDLIERRLRQRARVRPAPSPVKHYRGAREIPLLAPEHEGEFPRVLFARRTWRRFAPRPIPFRALSTLLGISFGVIWWVELPGLGRVALKTSPSAGARHPMEAYLLALRVEGLTRGLYHYAADTHRLELVRSGATPAQASRYLAGQWWYGAAGAIVLLTAVFPRNQWKYEDAGAYRTVLLDAGHACQTFCLAATWLGLAPFSTMALADSVIEKDLRVDGRKESVIYAAGVGLPKEGTDWAPWPTRPRGLRRPNAALLV